MKTSYLVKKKVAIVYDWLDKWGGVERILLVLHEIFPSAEFYTSYWDKRKAKWAAPLKIRTSFIDRFPSFIKKNRLLSFGFYPLVFESFDFSGYDLVISVSSSFAKSIITKPGTKHISYLLTPTRYLWLYPQLYIKKSFFNPFVFYYLRKMKQWDYVAAQRPDEIISISKIVVARCQKYYQRKSKLLYPPFAMDYWRKIKLKILRSKQKLIDKFKVINSKRYFLVVSRLEPYKRIDLVIDVFNQNREILVIVGEGTEIKKLKRRASSNIYFFSRLSDQELGWLYTNAQALIMPQEEDFGYTALEAQFFGCPVIAYKKGGAVETVVDGKSGIFFDQQKVEALRSALERYKKIAYNLRNQIKLVGSSNIKKFDKKIFIDNFVKSI